MRERLLKTQKRLHQTEGGFTILEIVFVILIFAILTSTVLFNFRTFSARIQFDNLSQDIALKIIGAQKAAMNGVINSNFTANGVKPAYGMYFTTASSGSVQVDNNLFVYFTDIPNIGTGATDIVGDKMYVPNVACGVGTNNECLSATAITTGEYISKICSDALSCSSSSSADVSIVFIRPFPDAHIFVHQPHSTSSTPTNPSNVCIELTSPIDATLKRTIRVNGFGQVSTLNQSAVLSCP